MLKELLKELFYVPEWCEWGLNKELTGLLSVLKWGRGDMVLALREQQVSYVHVTGCGRAILRMP